MIANKIILVGHGGGGKDYAKTILENYKMKPEVSYTTRKPRTGEIAGTNYHYVTENEFLKKIYENEFVQWAYFGNGHAYGTEIKEWENKHLFIMTPEALEEVRKIYKKKEKDYIVIFFNTPEEVRRERLSKRENADVVDVRLGNDKKQFEGFKDFDVEITNPEFKETELLHSIFSNQNFKMADELRNLFGN